MDGMEVGRKEGPSDFAFERRGSISKSRSWRQISRREGEDTFRTGEGEGEGKRGGREGVG